MRISFTFGRSPTPQPKTIPKKPRKGSSLYFVRKRVKVRRPAKNMRAYRESKELARTIILAQIASLNTDGTFPVRRIAIRNNTSRWGSCSKAGNLNFHYKTALLSPELCQYVVVHELCHLKEFNHSARFWLLVETILPQYKTVRAQLRVTRM